MATHPDYSQYFEYQTTIIETHLDTFGHMNNATYLRIFEEARWELITQRGFGLKEVQKRKMGPTILSIQIQFQKEIRNRERIKIYTRCREYKKKIGIVEQIMVNESGEAACTAEFVFGLFDMVERRLIPPTPEWLRAIGVEPEP